MSIEPSQAPSMRAKAVRLLPSSTTAMFIGTPISSALACAASTTAWALLNVTMSATALSFVAGYGYFDNRPALRCWLVCRHAGRRPGRARSRGRDQHLLAARAAAHTGEAGPGDRRAGARGGPEF